MASRLIAIITDPDPSVRDQALDGMASELDLEGLLGECAELDRFRRSSDNLYERVRALFFLYALHRFHIPERSGLHPRGRVPAKAHLYLLQRRFEEAIRALLDVQSSDGPSDSISSALALAYRDLGFQTLADQVRRSVRTVTGNRWMFRTGHPADMALRLDRRLLSDQGGGRYPTLCERTPVRMDLTHSAWSDIFFLGMDRPEGAQVLNISVDLGVRGRDTSAEPPIETRLRVLPEPTLRLHSVDLGASVEIQAVHELFDFAKDHAGLLKAAVIASGLVPPGFEGSSCTIAELFETVLGPGRGLELTTRVRGIPKGSRLAVSTNLLASCIALIMRATGQVRSLEGGLTEPERRLVAARAILGEWLGGSGGGWQDSGGVWPGMKLIRGALADPGDPEFGVSRGRLLPNHEILGEDRVPTESRRALEESLVLVHGGMAQDVGPILEMVTERYLLRSEQEWKARAEAEAVLGEILGGLREGDVRRIGAATTHNFFGPLQAVLPWASNAYTEAIIEAVRGRFGDGFWGFWMLGGMAGGGMGFMFDPSIRAEAQEALGGMLLEVKASFSDALPFAMDPVVYDFAINDHGTVSELMEPGAPRDSDAGFASPQTPPAGAQASNESVHLDALLRDNGFDAREHESIASDLRRGVLGLARNRLAAETRIEDARPEDVLSIVDDERSALEAEGQRALAKGELAIVVLAAGLGSRWSQGAGVVKGLNPFARIQGRYRSFVDVHLAKARRSARLAEAPLPLVLTTSYLTHRAIQAEIEKGGSNPLVPTSLSRGRAIGLRLIPTERDLRFAFEEGLQQRLEEQAQKVRDSQQAALIDWAKGTGEATNYRDSDPQSCLHPVGHGYEIPSLLMNGTLARLLAQQPQLRTLLLHNVDTLGASADPALLALHRRGGAGFSFEVVERRIEDRGGGLARVDGNPRIVESLALPREEDDFLLSHYNSMTTWIEIDALLELVGLDRDTLGDAPRVESACGAFLRRLPAYVTIKDVKKRWGHGQEDIFPVTQFERLWSDITSLPDAACQYLGVPRFRGQQLKEPAQLDGWLRDGSAAWIESLGDWESS